MERHKTTITSQMITNSLRAGTLSFGEEKLGFRHKEVVTHSIWSELAMELYLAKVYTETIMIMGRWVRSAFLRYIRIQVSDLSKCISTLTTNNHAFYTIPEIEVVYHTTGQPDTDTDENTQLPSYRYRAKMASKEGNTTSLPIYFEHQHGNMI